MFQGLHVTIVLPAYNVSRFVEAAVQTLPQWVDRVVVVDDASQDDTASRVEKLRDRRLTLVRHATNRGVGAAIVTGYREALQRPTDSVVVMAGDGQMHPDDLPGLLAPLSSRNAEYVKGNRFAWPGGAAQMPLVRMTGNLALSLLTRVTSGYREVMDSQCGYTAVEARTLSQLDLDALYPRYGYPNDLLAHLHSVGARLAQVPVRPIYEGQPSGLNPLRSMPPLALVLLRSWGARWLREHRAPHHHRDGQS